MNKKIDTLVQASINHAIDFLKSIDKALNDLDMKALSEAQSRHDAIGALKIAQKALYGDGSC